jgi:hypothetical protein
MPQSAVSPLQAVLAEYTARIGPIDVTPEPEVHIEPPPLQVAGSDAPGKKEETERRRWKSRGAFPKKPSWHASEEDLGPSPIGKGAEY